MSRNTKPPSPSPATTDALLAEAAAVWAAVAPVPQIALRPGIDYTVDTYADALKLSHSRAQSSLQAAHKAGTLAMGRYRLPGMRQPCNVYWPATLPPPPDATS